jgi:hypothetical protein
MNYALHTETVKQKRPLLSKQQVPNETLINSAWLCAYSSLWKTASFSNKEIWKAKDLIKDYLMSAGNPARAYSLFCQRVLLTAQYLQAHAQSYVPLPSQWLDRNNSNGFSGTKRWMEKVLEQRSSLPYYKIELKAFAEALLELATEPTAANFLYWKSYFVVFPELFDLFLHTVALQQFQTK